MSTLHIISRRLDASGLATLVRSRAADDTLLLCGDAVYLALQTDFLAQAGVCTALAADIDARGLAPLWPATVRRTDHAGFVALVVAHAKAVSWA